MKGQKKMIRGFRFTKFADGSLKVVFDGFQYIGTLNQVSEWVWNQANNHDQSNAVCHGLCAWFHRDLNGDPFFA
jgi:hypothetical protein